MDRERLRRNDETPDICLQVPGEDVYLELLRSVVGRAARLKGFTYTGIEDLTLAVDEAAVLLLESKPRWLYLELRGLRSAGRLEAAIVMEGEEPLWPPPLLDQDTRWQILEALCEDVWTTEPPGIALSQETR